MGAQRKAILVVEDDRDIREMLVELLRAEGYDVHSAADGRQALAFLAAWNKPCVILADLLMPEMDGRELIAALRSDSHLAAIPVVVVTAAGTTQDDESVAHRVLRKPFKLESLLDVVAECCGQ